jgi:hypothetical protein
MKKILIHSIPVLISCIQLIVINQTFNPISLKGPHFLKFYLILVFGFYASVFALELFKESISKTTFYFMISIFLLGIIKLIKGVFIGKPVGFLIMILILECIVMLFISLSKLKYKMKQYILQFFQNKTRNKMLRAYYCSIFYLLNGLFIATSLSL